MTTWAYAVEALRSLAVVRRGVTPRDKWQLLANRLRLGLYPLHRAALRRSGRPLLREPRRPYRVRGEGLVFWCARGRSEEQLLPRFEPEIKAEVDRLETGDFLDIGASIGVHAVRAAAALRDRGRVVAMEPHPLFADLLRRTRNENGLANLRIREEAAWSSRQVLTLHEHVFGGDSWDNSVTRPLGGPSLQVAASTVDDVVDEERLDRLRLVKIDAEGAEPEIFRGMTRTLDRFPRLRVVFEALEDSTLRTIRAFLASRAYEVTALTGSNFLAQRAPGASA